MLTKNVKSEKTASVRKVGDHKFSRETEEEEHAKKSKTSGQKERRHTNRAVMNIKARVSKKDSIF